ncbi:uncharacterized protein LOC122856408 [Aphidius gifuensis]|uniref:uncharacterized protein LOC122856408 n=1 Tax=Aphidius gifuensis TaxID=684658 RepID=UPI001CDCDB6B|nr:uncharacterized protein LOC122856408 [Aphidius gifuensis]
MNRWRRSTHPRTPRTLLEYNLLINQNQWSKYREYPQGMMVVHTIYIDRSTSATIFGNPDFLSTLVNIQELYLDATFRDCPRLLNITQLFTIMGRIDNSTVPLAWALMTRKTAELYEQILRHFQTHLAPNIIPTMIHQDFEQALRNAAIIVFPHAQIIHCYFHYCQAIIRRIKSRKGEAAMIRLMTWDIGLAFVRKILCLPLLPRNEIQQAYNFLIRNAPVDVLRFFEDLVQYYPRTWLTQDRLTRLSVYQQADKTNNPIESYHRVIHTLFGPHPKIWQFTAKLKQLQAFTHIEVTSLNRGLVSSELPTLSIELKQDHSDQPLVIQFNYPGIPGVPSVFSGTSTTKKILHVPANSSISVPLTHANVKMFVKPEYPNMLFQYCMEPID